MKQIIVDVPGMYGDHHVLRLREVLLGTKGVSEVTASAARRKVAIRFEEADTSPEAIREVLASAGYSPDQPQAAYEFPDRHKDGSTWYVVPDRVTTTERKDREMAGDFRRY
jgi:copper chaperone CopZ